MKSIALLTISFILSLSAFPLQAWAHCQIPCGIYGDETRFKIMHEHIETIMKSMNKIAELSEDPTVNMNQIVRWVQNKETHADEISSIAQKYFLAQRIKKPSMSDKDSYTAYTDQLIYLHGMIVSSMKAKQSTELEAVAQLKSQVNKFRNSYFGTEDIEHLKEHAR